VALIVIGARVQSLFDDLAIRAVHVFHRLQGLEGSNGEIPRNGRRLLSENTSGTLVIHRPNYMIRCIRFTRRRVLHGDSIECALCQDVVSQHSALLVAASS
jgi:hypothetical protein